MERFLKFFGLSAQRKQVAERRLAYRAQGADKDYIGYIEDVLALCKLANPVMSEADKVEHILKGISEHDFQYLMARDSRTVESITQACRRLNETKTVRIPETTSTTLPPLPSLLQIPITESIRSIICDIM